MFNLIIAHPDDEIIFGGFDLLTNQISKVISVTCGNDIVRKKEFQNVMNYLKIDYEILNYKDNYDGFKEKDFNDLLKYKNVITHNQFGEYGHKQHIQLHNILKQNIVKVFKDFDEKLPKEIIDKKYELLEFYKSQEKIFLKEKIKYSIEHCRSEFL